MSKLLQNAREYEKEYLRPAADMVPHFHLTAPIGWMNDPNGFSLYKGAYHLFYQYHPFSTKWGPMHWGHAKTNDFLHWEHLPAALAPDADYDKDGCFSGGAIELPDGRHFLIYTGVQNNRFENGNSKAIQTQCVAFGDGIDYVKYEKNPVISFEHLPEGASIHDFRDPKIWKDGDCYYAVVVDYMDDIGGSVLFYKSEDGLNWRFVSILASSIYQKGHMWECPDLFRIDDKEVLLVSSIVIHSVEEDEKNRFRNICFIGSIDKETNSFLQEHVQTVDHGLDFYAMQTVQSSDGRRIMIAWMQNWQTCDAIPRNNPFFGQMTLPRELFIKNGKLYQIPVRELESYRSDRIIYRNVEICGCSELNGIEGRFVDMTMSIRANRESEVYEWFEIHVAEDKEYRTVLRYSPSSRVMRIDRSRSGLPDSVVNMCEFLVENVSNDLEIRLILDRYSMEVFVNGGAQTATTTFYTPIHADGISFESKGVVLLDLEKYHLNL